MCWRANVLTCLCADVPKCFACLCAHMPICRECLHAHVPTCLACLRAHMAMYLACLHAHVPLCLVCLCAHVATWLACLPIMCQRVYLITCHRNLRAHVLYLQITKQGFQWHVLLRFLVIFLCLFPVKYNYIWKVYTTSRNVSGKICFENALRHSCISLIR